MEGWPNGLTRKAESGWPSYVYNALARLFIEGDIKFLKAGNNHKALKEIGPTKEDLQLALRKAGQALIQKTRMVRKHDEEAEGVDGGEVDPEIILSGLQSNEGSEGQEEHVY